jgi:hypothetical protein
MFALLGETLFALPVQRRRVLRRFGVFRRRQR